jgi:hypothetical protein
MHFTFLCMLYYGALLIKSDAKYSNPCLASSSPAANKLQFCNGYIIQYNTGCPDERYPYFEVYVSETNCHTGIRFMSSERKTLNVSFHARLTRMRRHNSATMLGIIWTER